MKRRKVLKRLARRSKAYEETVSRIGQKRSDGFKRPGSNKGQL